MHWELWLLQSGGLPEHDALRAATIVGAAAIGLAEDIGSECGGGDAVGRPEWRRRRRRRAGELGELPWHRLSFEHLHGGSDEQGRPD